MVFEALEEVVATVAVVYEGTPVGDDVRVGGAGVDGLLVAEGEVVDRPWLGEVRLQLLVEGDAEVVAQGETQPVALG